MNKRFTRCAFACAAGLLWVSAFSALPAIATPSGTRVAKVFQLPCGSSSCGTGDTVIGQNDPVHGDIQVHVQSASSVGLDSVRLQGRLGDGSWICMRQWSTPSSSFSATYNWDTTQWPGSASSPPSNCPASSASPWGEQTRNGVYGFRVTATESVSGDVANSSVYAVDVSNAAAAPTWAAAPSVAGEDDREPVVTLSWNANPEPDITEYHYVRVDPNNEESEFAVSAARPGGQGCERNGDVYTCYDDFFPSNGFTGDYQYVLIAYRASPASPDHCTIGSSACVQSESSGDRTVTLTEPASFNQDPRTNADKISTDRGTPAVRKGQHSVHHGSSDPRPDYSEFYKGSFKKTLPYSDQTVFGSKRLVASGQIAPESSAPTFPVGRGVAVPLAAGMILMLVALHVTRFLRDNPS